MKKFIVFILSFIVLVSTVCQAQVSSKETIANDGVETTITNSYTGMYDGTTNEKAEEYFDKATRYTVDNDSKNAIKYYQKALKLDPTFVEAYDNLGRVYRGLGDLDKATFYYKKSIELYPEGIMAHQNLAVVYRLQKNYEGATKEYKAIIKIDPENPEGYFGLANIEMLNSNFEAALENAKKSLEIYKATDSHHLADGYYLCGLINYYQEKPEEAKKYLLQAESKGAKIDQRLVDELRLRDASPETQPENSSKEDSEESDSLKLETEEDFKKAEPMMVKAATWLEEVPLSKEPETRKAINAFVVQWMTGVSYVSLSISQETIPYMDCGECLSVFLGNYAKHAIETKNYEDHAGATFAATESVIRFYKANKSALGKNKEIEKLIKLQDKKELSAYLKE